MTRVAPTGTTFSVSAMVSIEVHRTEVSRRASDHLPLKAVIDVAKLRG